MWCIIVKQYNQLCCAGDSIFVAMCHVSDSKLERLLLKQRKKKILTEDCLVRSLLDFSVQEDAGAYNLHDGDSGRTVYLTYLLNTSPVGVIP